MFNSIKSNFRFVVICLVVVVVFIGVVGSITLLGLSNQGVFDNVVENNTEEVLPEVKPEVDYDVETKPLVKLNATITVVDNVVVICLDDPSAAYVGTSNSVNNTFLLVSDNGKILSSKSLSEIVCKDVVDGDSIIINGIAIVEITLASAE